MSDPGDEDDFPEQLDRHEAEIDRAIAEDAAAGGEAIAEDRGPEAKRVWVGKLLRHAQARLYYAQQVRGHLASREQSLDAADALHAAGALAVAPLDGELFRLSNRLNEALLLVGHPSGEELEQVSAAVVAILENGHG